MSTVTRVSQGRVVLSNPGTRSYVLISAALALPIVLLAMLQISFTFDRERAEVERRTLALATRITHLVDAALDADIAVMEAMATSSSFDRRDWVATRERVEEVSELNPHWRNVIVTDLQSGRDVINLRGGERPGSYREDVANVGGVTREGLGCPCVDLHVPVDQDQRYLLSVAVDPARYQAIVLQHAPSDGTTALVDREGEFVARSVDFENRVGTLSTQFVRDAIASSQREGIYVGTTWEGLQNHTAYYESPNSGWSTHIAIAKSLIDRPRSLASASVLLGVLLSLALAAGLIYWALRDLAARKRAEDRLAQTQKLEAVGQLTGGVAHDFNNLLTVMIGGLNMLLKRITDPQQRQIAEHMLEAAQRGDRLTKQLLAFSRGKQLELAPVDLHQLAPGMEELLRRSIGPGMTLEFNLDPTARWVKSDANQLELAILNCVINARDAMPDGGHIIVSTKPASDDMIELAVSDNGMGMPKDVADRAMEPFYTTKPAGKGTGLGLAQVFGAARQSGGSVEIDTAPGRGTSVRMLLPRTEPPPVSAEETHHDEPAPAPRANGQRVLVVDDEPGVRAFMADTLRAAGYAAEEAQDVSVALRQLESDPPLLLLTDYSMPGMTGLELAERGRHATPALKVLIVSGYADADALENSAARPALLRKPFDEAALLEAVRSVLAT